MKTGILLAMVLLLGAGSSFAEIGWAGNVWPNDGASFLPTGDLYTYCQVWKDGVTPGDGPGADIECYCSVSFNGEATSYYPAAVYQGEVGDNDEYRALIPQSLLAAAASVDVWWTVKDLTDGMMWVITQDQAGNFPPQTYYGADVLPNNLDVTFQVCLSGAETTGEVCVIGSADEIGGWGSGVVLTNVDGDLWEGTVTFLAGTNPTFDYKYRKDGCATWESVANRTVVLPADGTTSVVLEIDSWDNLPLGCGLATTLHQDTAICLQVCMSGVETTGPVCLTGNIDELTNWGDGIRCRSLADGMLYQACLFFPAGTPVPLAIEFKFKKDGCSTWESAPNRSIVLDDSLPEETTLMFGWDDGPADCFPVATDRMTWDGLKSLYR